LIEIELSFLGVLDRIAFQLHPPDTLNHLTSIEIYHRILAKHRACKPQLLESKVLNYKAKMPKASQGFDMYTPGQKQSPSGYQNKKLNA
jgi:hypothetical protein